MIVHVGPVERRADRFRRAKTDGAAEKAPQHVRHRNVLEALFEKDDERAEPDTETEARKRVIPEWLQLIRRVADGQDEQEPRDDGPEH